MNKKSKKNGLTWSLSWLKRVIIAVLGLWLTSILLFKFLPVPFSMVMVERQVSAWFRGDLSDIVHSDWVDMDQISAPMALAVIASEDQKFPEHWGFDLNAIQLALDNNDKKMRRLRGASTISQQTAKNLFLWDGRSWLRKGLEAGLTVSIEAVWSKRRILTVYLNVAEFGDGVFGVEQAAQHFFHTSASHLTAPQAALLAAVLPNPHIYKVNTPSAYVIKRQQWILRQMTQLGGNRFLQVHNLH